MSNKDLADMIDIAFGIIITLGSILWFILYHKEVRKEKKEAKHGEWVHREDMDFIDQNGVEHFHCMCKNCGFIHDFLDCHTEQYNFCPECGIDMRGEK